MADQVKQIVDALSKEPFNKTFNIISFDNLEPLQLLQILNDVFTYIDTKNKMDLREELPEAMANRMLKFLSLLNYQPQCSLHEYQTGIITGDKGIVYQTLVWLLPRVDQLKTRAYLGQYLVRIDVPEEILQDEEVDQANTEYVELVEKFKEVHKSTEKLKNSKYTAADVKKDIAQMEQEYEQIQKTIERKKTRVETIPNLEELLGAARNLRREQERQASITEQKVSLKAAIQTSEAQCQRLLQQLREIKAATENMSVDKLMSKLEDEYRSTQYLVEEKLPKEVALKKKNCTSLQKVLLEPVVGDDDIDELQESAQELQAELNELHQQRLSRVDPGDEKLAMFRKQAMMIARKKDSLAEELKEYTNEWNAAEEELNRRKAEMKRSGAEEVLTGQEFKQYVSMIRNKGNVYKAKRAHMADLRAEKGVLSRTVDILQAQYEHVRETIAAKEKEKGISGYTDTQDEIQKVSELKGETDEQKGKVLVDMSDMSDRLNQMIADKKSQLNPVIKELRPLRAKAQELEQRHASKKLEYERVSASVGSTIQSLEEEVKELRTTAQADESRYHFLGHSIKILELQNQRIDEELALYKNSDTAARKSSYRDRINRKITEQENLKKVLRDRHKEAKDKHGPNVDQMRMWKDIQAILACKRDSLIIRQQQSDKDKPTGENILIL